MGEGRRREFAELGFAWPDEVPDPKAEATFARSRLELEARRHDPHAAMLRLYRDLIALRQSQPALGPRGKQKSRTHVVGDVVFVHRDPGVLVVLNGGDRPIPVDDAWRAVLHTDDPRYGGLGATGSAVNPRAAGVFVRRRG